jgi:hypothetical protein
MAQYLGLNISDEIADAIATRTSLTKETKTEIVTMAIEKELGIKKDLNLLEKVEALDHRVASIEARLDA